jgi:hypothetical protein
MPSRRPRGSESLEIGIISGKRVASKRPWNDSTTTMTTNYKKMICYNLNSGDFQGYLGTQDTYVCLTDANGGVSVQWSQEGDDLYLDKQTDPTDRYLGADGEAACWGLKGAGYRYPVISNADGTISLASDPRYKLYGPHDANGVWWTKDASHPNILRFAFVGSTTVTLEHHSRLTAGPAGDFWEHSLDAGQTWPDLPVADKVAYCDLEVANTITNVKLTIHNHCNRPFRMDVYDAYGKKHPGFVGFDLDPRGSGTFNFPVTGQHYKTQGPYLDGDREQVPDPKFTITRNSGG